MIKASIISEHGYDEALLGLSMCNKSSAAIERMVVVAQSLAPMDGGHNSFLELIVMWLDIKAPLYWWKQMDRYRVGKSQISESTMHTIMRNPITQEDFSLPIPDDVRMRLESIRMAGDFERLSNELPCGYMQRRILSANYKCLRNIIAQRKTHKLIEWHEFIDKILSFSKHPDLLR